jgi:hypothetical protein
VSDFGLHFYNARWYDSLLGRFAQADTIIPSGVQGLDRYAYVNNNPLAYTDPSGHCGVKKGKFDGKYDCTADDIESATMEQRLAWFKGFLAVTEREEWFANIVGILEAFIDEGLGESGSWVSWVDAGTLEVIQNGYALFDSKQINKRAADMAWKDFFSATSDNERKVKWGAAEKLGNEHGISLANGHGAFMNEQEEKFLNVGNKLYRDLLATGQIEEFYGQMAADVGALYCDPSHRGFCNGWVGGWQSAGTAFGTWFGDPRSRIPLINQAPVYFVARLYLEK